jgi:hypothetical protein
LSTKLKYCDEKDEKLPPKKLPESQEENIFKQFPFIRCKCILLLSNFKLELALKKKNYFSLFPVFPTYKVTDKMT